MDKKKTVMLIITENCNLACDYCFEHNKSNVVMNFETAKKIIDKEINDDNYQNILFEFFGGEPFLEFDLIVQIHDYIQKVKGNKNVHCFATTNGTLIHGKIKDWLYKNRITFSCGISLDGIPEVHNANRNNSFEKIDISFFKNTWCNQKCKMTINHNTLNYLFDSIIYLENLGYKVTSTFAQGINWDEKDVALLERELKKFVLFYKENPDREVCDFLNKKLCFKYQKDIKWCGMGEDLKAYDTYGNYYPCQAFAPQTIGKKASIRYSNTLLDEFDNYNDNSCMNCKYLPLCPTCYGANFQRCGDYRIRDKKLCTFNKMIINASARIKFDRIICKNETSYDDYLELKSINLIQSI